VAIPAGTHRVEFEFVSRTQQAGIGLSAAGCVIALVLTLRRSESHNQSSAVRD